MAEVGFQCFDLCAELLEPQKPYQTNQVIKLNFKKYNYLFFMNVLSEL